MRGPKNPRELAILLESVGQALLVITMLVFVLFSFLGGVAMSFFWQTTLAEITIKVVGVSGVVVALVALHRVTCEREAEPHRLARQALGCGLITGTFGAGIGFSVEILLLR